MDVLPIFPAHFWGYAPNFRRFSILLRISSFFFGKTLAFFRVFV